MALSIRERRELRREARAFTLAYVELHPKATKAEVKAAAEKHFKAVGFDIATIKALLSLILEFLPIILQLFKK